MRQQGRKPKPQPNFTEGKIITPLLRFMLPVLAALFLQAMYGAVDLLVVGQFASSADVSGVSTGSQLTMTINNLITSFAMGITVTLGQQIGQGRREESGRTIGTGICIFVIFGLFLTLLLTAGAGMLADILNAPEEAREITISYIRICGVGQLVIVAYNLIGAIFRGIGDSTTPLISVAIACVFNIIGDLLLVAVCHMGGAGAAIATVAAQLISVIVSLWIIRRKDLPFRFRLEDVRRPVREIAKRVLRIGLPIALQDFLVSLSFLVILAIVNSLGLTASAGVGVAEKVCAFIMLVPVAFMQSMSAFVAQNIGAGKKKRALQTLRDGVLISFAFGAAMFYVAFFHGSLLAGIFTRDGQVIAAAADYLRAYAIDCLLTCFLFCFVGFYNGTGNSVLVMTQGIVGAFGVRIPVAFFMRQQEPVSLFHIGLATPCSTVAQILICVIALVVLQRRDKKRIRGLA